MTPLSFARENVRQMELDERNPHGEKRIPQRETRMRQRSRVDQGTVHPAFECLNRIYERSFMVRLDPLDLRAELGGFGPDQLLDLSQGGPTVDLGFPRPEQIEIGAVEDGDAHSALQALQPGVKLIQIVSATWGCTSACRCGHRARRTGCRAEEGIE